MNSMNCMMLFGVVVFGGGLVYGWRITQSMSGVSYALQLHLWALHIHSISHVGTMLS